MSTNGVFSFPILSDAEILDMMNQLNIPLESKDLTNPESKKVVNTFVNLISASSGIPPDEISIYDKENAKKYNLEGNQHLLYVITVFGPLSEYMTVCRVHDFAFSDLLQPTAARFREQLSAAINFIMFSDDVINKLRVHRDKKDQLNEQIRNVEYDIKVAQSRKDALEMQKQKDRDTVVEQKEKNKRLEEEIERLNIEQQRLKESNNAIKVQMKEITRTINVLEDQIRDENQTTLELGDKIVASPRKLRQDVADMKEEFSRLTAECRSLTLQSTDLKAQSQIVTQTVDKLASAITQLEDTKKLLDTRSELNTQLEGIENRIRELKTIIEDQLIEKKKYELQLKRQEEEVEDLRKKVAASSDSSSELLQNLSGEYDELKKQLGEMEKEEMETEQLLTSAQMEEQGKVEEYKKRMEVRVELMQQLIDRVHSYQVSVMQAFPK